MRPAPPRASRPPRASHPTRKLGLVIRLTLPLFLLAGCRDDVTPPPATPSVSIGAPLYESPGTSPDAAPSSPGGRPLGQDAPEPGTHFRLSDAAPAPASADAGSGPRSTFGEPVEGEALAALVARLPELPVDAADPVDYRMPPGPPRPVITGETIEITFPPPADPGPPPADPDPPPTDPSPPPADPGPSPAGSDEPLVVERFQPEGEVSIASHIAVTFSRPFAPLAANPVIDAMDVPVVLDPRPEGRWRWIGTRTLLFEPAARLPMATEYTVEVPAGIEASDGETLSEARRWTFRTPPVGATGLQTWVSSPDRRALLVVTFDQAIERDAIAPFVLLGEPHADIELRLATASDIAYHEGAEHYVDAQPADRWIALATPPDLPPGAQIEVGLGAGAPSAEGSRRSARASSIGSFEVYDRLRATSIWCGGPRDDEAEHIVRGRGRLTGCDPYSVWSVEFNNPIDGDSIRRGMVTLEPEVRGLRIEGNEREIQLRGLFAGRNYYTVRVAPGLRDIYEQVYDQSLDLIFESVDARPALVVPGGETLILDPAGPRALVVTSINNPTIEVMLYRVTPEEWPDYVAWRRAYLKWAQRGVAKGEPRPEPFARDPEVRRTLAIDGAVDTFSRVLIDLRPVLDDDLGHVVAIIEPSRWVPEDYSWQNQNWPHAVWLQSTNLGLDVINDATDAMAFVTNLSDGSPVVGAVIADPVGGHESEPTGADGLTDSLPYLDGYWNLIVARKGADTTFLPESLWTVGVRADERRWFVFDDRGIYRPGESVAVKGYVRTIGMGVGGDVEAPDADGSSVEGEASGESGPATWVLVGRDGSEVASGELQIGAFGAFDIAFDLPDDAPVGHARLDLRGGAYGDHSLDINIAEFRRPEFEVGATAEDQHVIVGERGHVGVEASYFAGGALPGAEVRWAVHAERSDWRPAGWGDFVFGRWRPWWMYWDDGGADGGDGERQELLGTTDVEGRHRLAIDLAGISPPATMSLKAQATVSDVNRQASSASAALIAHPSSLYVGVRAVEWVIERGDKAEVEVVAVDLDGAAVADRTITINAERLDHRYAGEAWTEVAEPTHACEVVSAEKPVGCSLELAEGGRFTIRASVVDDAGRVSESEMSVWVPGPGRPVGPVAPREEVLVEQVVEIIPDKDEYAVGDVANVLVRAPFAGAEALVSLRRSGLVEVRRMRLGDGSATITIPIEEGYVPNIHLDVQVVGSAPRDVGGGTGDATADATAGATAAAFSPGEGSVAERSTGGDVRDGVDVPHRPAFARGTQELRVPPLVRTLGVEVVPTAPQLRPGAEASVAVTVTDGAGAPLPEAQVVLVAVDEAVLALTGYRIPDPMEAFYTARGPDTADHRNRGYVNLTPLDVLTGAGDGKDIKVAAPPTWIPILSTPPPPPANTGGGPGIVLESGAVLPMRSIDELESLSALMAPPPPATGGGPGLEEPVFVEERTDLNPLAAFVPSLITDDDGTSIATFALPDSVTRYRITAIATDGAKRFGTGEADVTARLPLTARPSAPRFLNFGDEFDLPIVVQNLSGADQEVDVVVRAANLALRDAAEPSGPGEQPGPGKQPVAGARVLVPDGDRVEVRFPALAVQPGVAAFQAAAFAVDDFALADAQRVTLPVYTPATTEAFATYGQIDDGSMAQPVLRPLDVVPDFGGLEITTSSTALAELTDAFLYLESYPFECAEQLASRLIAIVSMRDVLTAFDVEGLQSEAEIDGAVADAVDNLLALQRGDGGFSWWSGRRLAASPWASLHATNALVRARLNGASVDDERLNWALYYLEGIRGHIEMQPAPWTERAKRAAEAYSLAVRRAAGGGEPADYLSARVVALLAESESSDSVETLGFLLQVVAGDPAPEASEAEAELARRLENRMTETASAATVATAYTEDEGALILSSDRRSDAIVLDAWMSHAPDSDLVPKLVRGLLDGRVRGRWSTTQENSFSLIALDRYFRTYEADEPNFTARAWVDETFAGEARFAGRSGDRAEINVPLDVLPESAPADLLLSKEGPGRLYYRLGLRYAPQDLDLPADERGFAVVREYESVDDPGDVRRRADGGWAIKAGARVRVRLRMDAPSRRYHVALVDPLPAGFEAINPELLTTEDIPDAVDDEAGGETGNASPWSWWGWQWYEHEAYRDHQVEVFAGNVPAGIYRYDYVARATTPGSFVVPPAKAEEMYHPETFGRSGTDRVVIE